MSVNRALAPSMIGRHTQLRDCANRLALAQGGAGQVILIAGEAGIGKTRLVREFVQAIQTSGQGGVDILEGYCSDDDPAVPYGPFIDALRQMVRTLGAEAVAAMAGVWGGDLARLLPELAPLTPAPPTADDPQTQKRQLFEAVAHVLCPRQSPGARMLVLEDVHWIDRTSQELLLYLARLIPRERLLVLATYRANEVESRPTLAHLVVELNRERLAHEIRLTPLSNDELATMLEAILRRHVPGGFVEMLHDRTGGNPFFAEEILESLLERDALDTVIDAAQHGRSIDRLGVPFSVSESIRGRTAGLSPETTVTLQYAATVGRRFDYAVLRELAGGDERELLRRIKAMIAAQLVVEESAEAFAFRHALTRQAVYEELLGRERAALHREIAEAMERVYAASLDAHTADLAYHCYEAGLWERALTYAVRAAEQAQRLHAPRAAVEQITRALDAARHVTAGDVERARLHLQRGHAYELLGDYDAALADREAALGCACGAADRHLEWQALNDLGMQWAAHDYQRTGEYYEQALVAARAMDDAILIAHSLNRVGNWHLNMEEPREAIQLHEAALTIFQDASDPRGTADTLDLLGMSALLSADMHRSAAYCAESVVLYRQLDDRRGLASSLAVRIVRATNFTSRSRSPAPMSTTTSTPRAC